MAVNVAEGRGPVAEVEFGAKPEGFSPSDFRPEISEPRDAAQRSLGHPLSKEQAGQSRLDKKWQLRLYEKWPVAARKLVGSRAGSGMFICVTGAGIRVSEKWQWQARTREMVQWQAHAREVAVRPHDQCGHSRERAVAGASGAEKWQARTREVVQWRFIHVTSVGIRVSEQWQARTRESGRRMRGKWSRGRRLRESGSGESGVA
ncbi:hypothetical protein HWV62_16868 [Athelia sp. TMB]|nr:hypothetical protein HWV62_16868 [Athelia sp. TMB]